MLSTADLQAELERVSYKPGWEFRAYDGAWHGQHLQIRCEVENTYRPGETVPLDIHVVLVGGFESPAQFHRWLLKRIVEAEVHEAREFFKVDGQIVFDPHVDGADRDLA
jgi:hypothetical protein